jgi:hypothetical protein
LSGYNDVMAVTQEMLEATAAIIADYRAGEIARPDAAHVQRWLNQFDENVREQMLGEMRHVLGNTYVSKINVEKFLSGLASNKELAGDDPKTFWMGVKFLDIQTRGHSQREFLQLFAIPLKQQTGLQVSDCGKQPACYVYLDDGIFTGMTLIQSLSNWLKGDAPQKAVVHVIVIAGHVLGKYYAETQLNKIAASVGKAIEFHWWALLSLEDRKANIDVSDVLRPTVIPDDARTQAYAKALKFSPVLRTPGNVGEKKFFSSEAGRNLLEQQLLIKGAYIREVAPLLPKYARPLGDMVLETLGFGSTFVTYRNCPNNAPLAFWAGDPWYPLFQRKTN